MTDSTLVQAKKRPFETFDTTVSQVEELTPRVKGIRFALPTGKKMFFHAGQFVQMHVPLPDGKVRRTSYSIASPPYHESFFELCVTLVDGGVSSTFLHGLKVGDVVKATGPLGKFTMPTPMTKDCVFIATGSGIAPFRSMIFDMYHSNTKQTTYLIFGNRYTHDIIYRREWEELAAKQSTFKLFFTLSRPEQEWTEPKGYVQDKIREFVPNPENKNFFICGLVKMIDAVSEKLISLGVPKEQIHFERYD